MKHINKLLFTITASVVLVSCAEKYDSGYMPDKPEQVALTEHLNSFGMLRSLINQTTDPNLKLGAGVVAGDFLKKEVFYSLIYSNFNEITPDNTMIHSSVVKNDGTMDFTAVNNIIEGAGKAGISIYGNTLCWNSNQNATYLNSLIAPVVFKTPLFPNSLNKAGLNDGTLSGWDYTNSGSGISIVDYNGLKAIQLISAANSSNPGDLRLTTPDIPVVAGHTYEVVMYIRSSDVGEGRIAFDGLNNNTPELDYFGTGKASSTFKTQLGWKKMVFQVKDFAGSTIKLHIDLGYKPNVTYLINVASITVCDINSQVTNPDEIFIEAESGTVGALWNIVSDMAASGGSYVTIKPGNNSTGGATANPDGLINYNYTVATSGTYTLWARVAVTVANGGDDSFFFKVSTNNWTTFNGIANQTGFTWYKVGTYTLGVGSNTLSLSYREDGAKLDRVYFTLTTATPTGMGTPVLSQKEYSLVLTDSDKSAVIRSAMDSWISGMVNNSKSFVTAWEVVKEPMDDSNPNQIKTSLGKTLGTTDFYWQDYLGNDYAVDAFNMAKKYGNASDKLFISDNNLESNLNKCQGLIDYVAYIESKGARVDGIATQMHISTSTDTLLIEDMFEKLAATGKLIKISELYVRIGNGVVTTAATNDDYIAQSKIYNFVARKYFEIIPAAQRYGITLWSPRDREDVTGNWLKNEPIGLWTTGYNRKLAYAGFAEGMKR